MGGREVESIYGLIYARLTHSHW